MAGRQHAQRQRLRAWAMPFTDNAFLISSRICPTVDRSISLGDQDNRRSGRQPHVPSLKLRHAATSPKSTSTQRESRAALPGGATALSAITRIGAWCTGMGGAQIGGQNARHRAPRSSRAARLKLPVAPPLMGATPLFESHRQRLLTAVTLSINTLGLHTDNSVRSSDQRLWPGPPPPGRRLAPAVAAGTRGP